MKRIVSAIVGLLLLSSVANAQTGGGPFGGYGVGSGGGSSTQTNIYPGAGFTAGAIIPSLVPTAAGKIWWVDGGSHCGAAHSSACSNSNDCLTPATSCLTITAALAKTVALRGDVVMVAGATYPENVTLSTYGTSLMGFASYDLEGINAGAVITPTVGNGLTLSGGGANYIAGFTVEAPNVVVGTSALVDNTGDSTIENCDFVGNENHTDPTVLLNAVSWGVYKNNQITLGKYGMVLTGSVGSNYYGVDIRNNYFAANDNSDIVATGTAALGTAGSITNNRFLDLDKFSYIDMSAAASGAILAANNWFNVSTVPGLKRSQLGNLTKLDMAGNWPPGDVDSSVNANNTGATAATASNIVTGGVTAFTALGNLLIDSISTQSDTTAITGCTDIQWVVNETSGALVVAEETKGNLSAATAITKNLSAGTVVPLVTPFTLSDGKTIVLKATGSNCTSAGLLNNVVKATRRQPYALLTVGAAATNTPTPTATASATPTATPTP